MVLWLTLPFQETPILVYLVGAVGATVLEYFTGEAMVRLFKVRYWDYSNQRIQYKGHICLSSSIAWGFLSLFMVYAVHKPVESFIFWMHEEAVAVLTFIITVCIVYDFSNAFRNAMDLRKMLVQAEQIRDEIEQRAAEKKRVLEAAATFAKAAMEESLEEKKDHLERELQELWDRQEQLKDRISGTAERLLMQNPGSRFMTRVVDTGEIREKIRSLKEKIEISKKN